MQRHSRLLIEYLAKSNQIDLVVIHPHTEKLFAGLNVKEEIIFPINKNNNYLFECYNYSKRVYEIILKYPEYIIYSQGLSVWYHFKKITSPIVINPHGLEPYQSLTIKEQIIAVPFKWTFNYLFKHATKVVSLGGKLTGILKSNMKDHSKITVLPNAVLLPDSIIPKKFENQKLKLLFIARFAHNKGIHILLEAIKQLNNEGYIDKLEFNLGGKGPLFEYYSSNYKYSNVNYLGFVSDEQLVKEYETNDLFVFPTLFEGMPTVVLEAMSYGMPVIVSDVGATAELINSNNGFLINKNSVEELKTAIIRFYNLSIKDKQQLSSNVFNHVKNNYTWDTVAKKHIELFHEIIDI